MDTFLLYIGVAIVLLMIASMYRGVFGPTVLDRIISVNAIGSKTVVLLILIGFLYGRQDMFVDIALAYAMLNFIAVVATAKYFYKRRSLGSEPCEARPGQGEACAPLAKGDQP